MLIIVKISHQLNTKTYQLGYKSMWFIFTGWQWKMQFCSGQNFVFHWHQVKINHFDFIVVLITVSIPSLYVYHILFFIYFYILQTVMLNGIWNKKFSLLLNKIQTFWLVNSTHNYNRWKKPKFQIYYLKELELL